MDRRKAIWRGLPVPTEDEIEDLEGPDDEALRDYAGEPRCKTCSAADPDEGPSNGTDVRGVIDAALLRGATYSSVLRLIEPLVANWPAEQRPSLWGIRRHAQKHLKLDAMAIRAVMERRAIEQGVSVAIGDAPIVTFAATLELVRNRGIQAIAAGEVTPTVRETVAAAEALDEIELEAGRFKTVAELSTEVRIFLEVVQRHVGPGAWAAVLAEFQGPAIPRPDGSPVVAITDGYPRREDQAEEDD